MRKGIIMVIFKTDKNQLIGRSSAPGNDDLYQELAKRLLSAKVEQ
jgi:hypothetical protein